MVYWDVPLTTLLILLVLLTSMHVFQKEWQTHFRDLSSEMTVYGWSLPGKFGYGARFEVHFELPSGVSPSSFLFLVTESKLADMSTFDVQNDESSLVLALGFTRTDDRITVTSNDGRFVIGPFLYRVNFTYNISLVVSEAHVEAQFADKTLPLMYAGQSATSVLITSDNPTQLPNIRKIVFLGA